MPNRKIELSDASRVIHPILDVHAGTEENQSGGRWYSPANSVRRSLNFAQTATSCLAEASVHIERERETKKGDET